MINKIAVLVEKYGHLLKKPLNKKNNSRIFNTDTKKCYMWHFDLIIFQNYLAGELLSRKVAISKSGGY